MKNKSWSTILSKIPLDFAMRKGITSYVNPYGMLLLKKQDSIVDRIDYWYLDGWLLTFVFSILFKRRYQRFSPDNTSMMPTIFKFAKENHLKVAIIGTKEEYINAAVINIEKKYEMKITYYRNGYFQSEVERTECYNRIIDNEIDIVICGMGTPYQENFLIGLTDCGWSGYGFTCGGYIHQTSKKSDYYPPVFDKLNIRWIYRIIDEPKLVKRYFVLYPIFLIKFLFFVLKHRKKIEF